MINGAEKKKNIDSLLVTRNDWKHRFNLTQYIVFYKLIICFFM